VKFCKKIGEPPSKPKYILKFDSALVPRGKGEIDPIGCVKQILKFFADKQLEFYKNIYIFMNNNVPFV